MKPVLVGMINPHSDDPDRALGVVPVNASGYRLWQMISIAGLMEEPPVVINDQHYEDGFDRRNITTKAKPVVNPPVFLKSLKDSKVVLCGATVARALGLSHSGFHLEPQWADNFWYYVIPHPSGLCREYNDPDMRIKVGRLLLKLWKEGQ